LGGENRPVPASLIPFYHPSASTSKSQAALFMEVKKMDWRKRTEKDLKERIPDERVSFFKKNKIVTEKIGNITGFDYKTVIDWERITGIIGIATIIATASIIFVF